MEQDPGSRNFRSMSAEQAKGFAEAIDPYETVSAQSRAEIADIIEAEVHPSLRSSETSDKILTHEFVDHRNSQLGHIAIDAYERGEKSSHKPFTANQAERYATKPENREKAKQLVDDHRADRSKKEIQARVDQLRLDDSTAKVGSVKRAPLGEVAQRARAKRKGDVRAVTIRQSLPPSNAAIISALRARKAAQQRPESKLAA